MQFTTFVSLLASAALASANSVLFASLDGVDRTIYFTGNPGMARIETTRVNAGAEVKVSFPHGWTGNFYSVSDGAPNAPGMLGEVAFNAWNDIHFFDVSAIVNPNDHVGIKQMWPASSTAPMSGCRSFPCNNAYYLADDVQTKSTTEPDLICTLGDGVFLKDGVKVALAEDVEGSASPVFKRDFVEGRWARQ